MKKERKITKQQYERAKQIVSKYEAQFSLSFVRGSFQASDLEYLSHSVGIPKIKDGMLSDLEMTKLQSKLDDLSVPWFDLGTDDIGFLVIGAGKRTDYTQYEKQLIEALNNL